MKQSANESFEKIRNDGNDQIEKVNRVEQKDNKVKAVHITFDSN